jgi:hypothetical protein
MVDEEKERQSLSVFRRSRIMTITQLAQHLDCSIPTVRNRLRSWKALTSYNRNGRYYALANVAKFDEHGLWKYKGVCFSRWGTLKNTVHHLVKNSPMGLDASEIGRLVGLPHRSFMAQLRNVQGLRREKVEKRFVYYADEEHSYRTQRTRRAEQLTAMPKNLPSDTEAIFILVDRIKHPEFSEQQCAQRLRSKGKNVSVVAIRNLLAYHGIEKKTPDTSSSGR